MKKLKIKLVIAAAVATFSTMSFGTGAATAQDNEIKLCPEGQTYEFVYECNSQTRICKLVFAGCV